MPITADQGSTMLTALLRAVAFLTLGLGFALLLVFAAAAAVIVGLMIAGAALALRFAPRPLEAKAGGVLDARRTPAGWVVEGLTRRQP
jgi:hypothetical protein